MKRIVAQNIVAQNIVAQLIVRAGLEFKYGLVNRPPSLGAVPNGYTHYDPDNQGIDGVRHGVLTYDRKLTDQEVKQHEMMAFDGKDGKPLEHIRFPQAVIRKAQEAIDSLNYVRDENLDLEDEDIKEEVTRLLGVIKIFRDYASRKHLDADKALAELGYEAF